MEHRTGSHHESEQKARQQIDHLHLLTETGWLVQDYADINIHANTGVAVREFSLKTGFADYLLYADGQVKRLDLDEFVECHKPGKRHLRKPTWDADKCPDGRWRSYDYDELVKRDKVNLDIFWLKDKSLEDSEDLLKPDVLAEEIADDLETALEQFQVISAKLKRKS